MTGYKHRIASPQHRLAGRAVDVGLYVITFGIGWIIWSLILWQQGQTPGKQILKLRTYNQENLLPAKWGHMAIREFLLPQAVSIVLTVPILILASPVGPTLFTSLFSYIGIALLTITYLTVCLVDVLWIFRQEKYHRLVDVIAKTDVLNEAPATA